MEIKDLGKQLLDGMIEFADKTISISGNGLFLSQYYLSKIQSLSFHNCTFKGSCLEFEDIDLPDFLLGFYNCTFEIPLEIKNCNFKRLGFRDINSNKHINITKGHYPNFFFKNNDPLEKNKNILDCNITIINLTVNNRFELDFLNHTKGQFEFRDNKILDDEIEDKDKIITFGNSTFEKARFSNTKFGSDVKFAEMEITQSCKFDNCEFDKVDFSNIILGEITFSDCKFHKTSVFHYITGSTSSHIKFESCLFEKYIQLNESSSSKLEIYDTDFNKNVSFQDTKFDTISINRTIFEKGALFDGIVINKIENCDRRTIRTIKQELQKTENKIDFNKFRAYELQAHYKELDWKWRTGFKDKFILWATKWSTDFGNSWRRALLFTLGGGLTFYTTFYISEIYISGDYKYYLNTYPSFWSGLFRFFLVTDFYNPLIEDRTYLQNTLSWFIFFLGKIFIAFGIYEMIQAFRKFKA